jgi:excisionase family DNA binding protein
VTSATDSVEKWLTVPEVAELLDIPLGKVRRLVEEHHLIAVRRDGVQMIPAELIVDGEPLSSLRGTILVLLDSGFSLEAAVEWLYSIEDTLGTTPIAALLSGRKTEIRRLAMALAL